MRCDVRSSARRLGSRGMMRSCGRSRRIGTCRFRGRGVGCRVLKCQAKSMRIALVILHADPSRGGAERYTVDLAGALSERGVDVTLVASTIPPEVKAKQLILPVDGLTRLRYYESFI